MIRLVGWLKHDALCQCTVGKDRHDRLLMHIAGHSGLTCSRFDDLGALPVLYPHAVYPGFAGDGNGMDQPHWAHACQERADQATATSPLRPLFRSISAMSAGIPNTSTACCFWHGPGLNTAQVFLLCCRLLIHAKAALLLLVCAD